MCSNNRSFFFFYVFEINGKRNRWFLNYLNNLIRYLWALDEKKKKHAHYQVEFAWLTVELTCCWLSVARCLLTCSLRSGAVLKTSCNCKAGSWSKIWCDKGLMRWQHLMKPSHTLGCFQIHLPTNRCIMMMTKPVSLGNMVTDWITVRMYNVGMGDTSMRRCITVARTSWVYICFSAKHNEVAKWFRKSAIKHDHLKRRENNW